MDKAKQAARRREYQKEYRKLNKERIYAQNAAWSKEHPEAHREACRRYYERNRDTLLQQQRVYRMENRDEIRKRQAEAYRRKKAEAEQEG